MTRLSFLRSIGAVALSVPLPTLAQVSFQGADNIAISESDETLETSAIAAGDYDRDGDVDLFAVKANLDLNEDTVVIIENDGNGNFSIGGSIDVRSRPVALTLVDLNGDEILDLAIALLGSNEVAVLLGEDGGTFGEAERYETGVGPRSLTIADTNDDGAVDLITANEEDDTLTVLLNNGAGFFSVALTVDVSVGDGSTRSQPRAVAIGIFDGDGLQDLAVALSARNQIGVLINNRDDTFSEMMLVDVGRDPQDLEVGDFNGDEAPDIAVANTTADTISILLGLGAAEFGALPAFDGGNNPEDIDVADMDGDGNLDIVTANREGDNVSVHLGLGDGMFGAARSFNTGGAPVSVVLAFLNDDNDPDMATANQEADVRTRDDVSILLAGVGTDGGDDDALGGIFDDLLGNIDCGSCGALGVAPLLFTFIGISSMKRRIRR